MSTPTKVTAADQEMINKFARIYQNHLQLKEELKELQNDVDNLNEAADEILLLDDVDASSIPLKIGDTFVHYETDVLADKLEKLKEVTEALLGGKTETNNEIETEMDKLRKYLYGKFGDKINLESEKDD